jgi:hypothetical protein
MLVGLQKTKMLEDSQSASSKKDINDSLVYFKETRILEDGVTFVVSEMPQFLSYGTSFIEVGLGIQ